MRNPSQSIKLDQNRGKKNDLKDIKMSWHYYWWKKSPIYLYILIYNTYIQRMRSPKLGY